MLDFTLKDVEDLYIFMSKILMILQSKLKCKHLYKSFYECIDDLSGIIFIMKRDFDFSSLDKESIISFCDETFRSCVRFYYFIIDEVILYGL